MVEVDAFRNVIYCLVSASNTHLTTKDLEVLTPKFPIMALNNQKQA